MSRFFDRPSHLWISLIVGLLCLVSWSGCAPVVPASDRLIPTTSSIRVFEGLPHPMSEQQAFEAEKSGPTPNFERAGSWFYRDPLPAPPDLQERLARILQYDATYRAFSGEKKCGGFHADYAVAWSDSSATRTALICFSCGEVKLDGPDGFKRHDLGVEAQKSLRKLLTPLHQNRPVTEDHHQPG